MNTDECGPKLVLPSTSNENFTKRKFIGIGYWNAYIRGDEYQSLTPGEVPISEDELSQHCSPQSMWMALREKSQTCVYDVTKFAEYHPGGFKLIADNSGVDASEAFRNAHPYVSLRMISRLKKGVLIPNSRKKNLPNFLSPSMNICSKPTRPKSITKPRWDWNYDASGSRTILNVFLGHHLISPIPSTHCIAFYRRVCETGITQDMLTLRILCDAKYYYLKIRLIPKLHPDLRSMAFSSGDISSSIPYPYLLATSSMRNLKMDLYFKTSGSRLVNESQLSTLGSVIQDNFMDFDQEVPTEKMEFFPCRIILSNRLATSKYRHLRLQWPSEETNISVPLLHHVTIRITDAKGETHFRQYTPVCLDYPHLESDNLHIDILIKVYSNGLVSQLLDKLQINNIISVSLPSGNLHPSLLLKQCEDSQLWKSIIFFAGGSGFTPFLRTIALLLSLTVENCTDFSHCTTPWLRMLWFNKTTSDLVLVEELETMTVCSGSRFTLHHILSEISNTNPPDGFITGDLTDEVCRSLLPYTENNPFALEDILWLICGPPGFNDTTMKLLGHWKVPIKNIHVL